MPKIEDTEHSPLGPSQLKRIIICKGSVNLGEEAERQGKVPPPSKHAAEGTAAHAVACSSLKLALSLPLSKEDIKPNRDGSWPDIEVDGFTFEVNEEMLEAVDTYVNYIVKLVDEFDLNPRVHVQIEQYDPIPGLTYKGETQYGSTDCRIWIPFDHVKVIDFKYGAGVQVDPEGNEQLLGYGVAGIAKLPPLVWDEMTGIDLVIIQPRGMGPAIKTSFVHADSPLLKAFAKELRGLDKKVQDPNATRVPGDHCRFCPAKLICEESRAPKELAIATAFDAVPVKGKTLPKPETLSPAQITLILANKPGIIDYLESVEAYAHHTAKIAGTKYDGYKVVETEGNRKYAEGAEEAIIDELFGDIDPDPDSEFFTKPKLLSPAQLEKLCKKEGIALDVNKFCVRPKGTKLVPESDKRPALPPLAKEAFKGVPIKK